MSKIIVDCSREENYSVAILDNQGKLDSFSFENQQKKTIKSNIYLGRITRVEYSLQAAFVEYGGDKAGFLPFSEIHPSYYNLPKSYKEELQQALREEESLNEKYNNEEQDEDGEEVETDNENTKEKAKTAYRLYKKYSIQEVIKRGQTVLVQVYKDERGNKGVSLTTYISLPGRYCVLMPNSPRGIGISKKIYSYEERKRVLNIIKDFNVPYGTGLIVRTAGMKASVDELKKDYKYLCDLWDEIRMKAVNSKAEDGAIYEEVNIVEQIIRDSYESDDNSQIIVSGQKGYEEIKAFVQKLMPHELPKLKLYNDKQAIFKKFGIDKRLDELLSPIAPLPSGGYLVINPTEALISIDVNSGKSIHGKNVEETALATNIEAAHEVAKQLRLRNLGGLIVVDFIDMDELKNRRILEKELQKAFMFDKAKVQFAKVSQFGLVEISRQRMRSSVAEMMTIQCPCCSGTGLVKAPSLVSVDILDSIKEQLQNTHIVRKEFFEVLARAEVINHLVVAHIKEIEEIQKKYNVKIITTKHHFEKNEEYVLRMVDTIGDSTTAVELYHNIAAKFVMATDEQRVKKPVFKLFAKMLGWFIRKDRKDKTKEVIERKTPREKRVKVGFRRNKKYRR